MAKGPFKVFIKVCMTEQRDLCCVQSKKILGTFLQCKWYELLLKGDVVMNNKLFI